MKTFLWILYTICCIGLIVLVAVQDSNDGMRRRSRLASMRETMLVRCTQILGAICAVFTLGLLIYG